jgi:hypothetical protein
MKEFRLAHRGSYWHLEPSRHIHAAKFIQLDHALNYLHCRIRTAETALVTITDAVGATERRLITREAPAPGHGVVSAPPLPVCLLRHEYSTRSRLTVFSASHDAGATGRALRSQHPDRPEDRGRDASHPAADGRPASPRLGCFVEPADGLNVPGFFFQMVSGRS